METLKTINSHRSIRNFKSDPIPEDILNNIIIAASRGSNTGNMQLYSIIITKENEQKHKLWEYHFKQNMVLQAPVILTFCADINRFSKWCRQRNAEPGYNNFLWFTNAVIDAIIAAQNASIAAEDARLGICYLGTTTYMADKLVDFFKCPKGVVPITTLVIGYPDESPDLVNRLPANGIVHYEAYSDYSESFIDEIFAEKEQLESTQLLLKENELPNLARIFTEKRYVKKDNEHFSKSFLELISKQGFMEQE